MQGWYSYACTPLFPGLLWQKAEASSQNQPQVLHCLSPDPYWPFLVLSQNKASINWENPQQSVSCGKINGIGSLHRALKQDIHGILLSGLSQEMSERRWDFKLFAESDQSQQPSSSVRCFDGDSVLSKFFLWQIFPPQRGLKANTQRWSNISDCNKKTIVFWTIWLGLVRREAGRDRLNSSCYFPNPTFLWMQTLHLAALNVPIVQVMGKSYVGLRQFYHFVLNS